MRTIETRVYKIDEHPNPELCYEYIRDHWHDLNQHSVDEVIDSLKALQKIIGGELDWCIGQTPDRGEYLTFEDYDREALCRLSIDDLPLTGTWCDYVVIKGLREHNPKLILESIHNETEYRYSDEGLKEYCEMNKYEFEESGKFYND